MMRKLRRALFFGILGALLPVFLTSCFVLNIFFPLPGKAKRNLSVFLHYKNLSLENHEMVSVELYLTKVEFGGKSLDVKKAFVLSIAPASQTQNLTDFFSNEHIVLGQYTFSETEANISKPSFTFTCGNTATITYHEYVASEFGGNGTVEATAIAFNLANTTFEAPVMQLSSARFDKYASLTLPGGQSRLILMLNLKSIPTLQALKGGSDRSFSLSGSISMVSRDLCFVYGSVSDLSSAGTLVPGQYWTVDFDQTSGLVFEDYYWGFGTYTQDESLKSHRYFFFAPQITNQSYPAVFELYLPGHTSSVGRKEFEVPDVDELRVDMTIQSDN